MATFSLRRGLSAFALSLAALSAQATVLTFDDLPALNPDEELGKPIGASYGGFTWSTQFQYLSSVQFAMGGYVPGTISGTHVAYNSDSKPVSVALNGTGTFDFDGAYLTAARQKVLQVKVDSFLDGVLQQTKTVSVNDTSPTWFDFGFSDIDRLQFTSLGDENDFIQFVMDNFTFNSADTASVTEPSSLLLLGAALGGVGWARRRYNTKAAKARLAMPVRPQQGAPDAPPRSEAPNSRMQYLWRICGPDGRWFTTRQPLGEAEVRALHPDALTVVRQAYGFRVGPCADAATG